MRARNLFPALTLLLLGCQPSPDAPLAVGTEVMVWDRRGAESMLSDEPNFERDTTFVELPSGTLATFLGDSGPSHPGWSIVHITEGRYAGRTGHLLRCHVRPK